MKKYIQFIKSNKVLSFLILISVLFIIGGSLFLAIQNNDIKKQVHDSLINYFNSLNKSKYNYTDNFISSIISNFSFNIVIWLLGISLIGIPIVILLYCIKCIGVGFTLTSFIYFYGLKGILLGTIYIIPSILSLLILFITTYYSINFSLILFQFLFEHKEFNKKLVLKRYIKILISSNIILLVCSILESYIIPKIIIFIIK